MTEQVEAQTFFKIVDGHSHRITQLERDSAVFTHQIKSLERSNQEICLQLKTTEVRIMDSRKIDSDKLDMLIANEHKREGAANSARWLPIIIQCIVGLTVLYAFFNK